MWKLLLNGQNHTSHSTPPPPAQDVPEISVETTLTPLFSNLSQGFLHTSFIRMQWNNSQSPPLILLWYDLVFTEQVSTLCQELCEVLLFNSPSNLFSRRWVRCRKLERPVLVCGAACGTVLLTRTYSASHIVIICKWELVVVSRQERWC
jgi:hypothetical protein